MELDTGEPQYTPRGIRKLPELDREQRDAYRDKVLAEHIDNIQPLLGQRTLVTTDFIWLGRSIDRIAKVLHQRGVAFDIATLGTHSDSQAFFQECQKRPEFAGVRWFTGGDESEKGVLYSRADQLEENPFRQAIGTEKDWLGPIAKRAGDFDAERVRAARAYLAAYSDELYRDIAPYY